MKREENEDILVKSESYIPVGEFKKILAEAPKASMTLKLREGVNSKELEKYLETSDE